MYPLVRKKSGELLKPSLRSSVSSRKFSVKFNSTIDVKHFNGDESPKCVSGQNSPVLSPGDDVDFDDDYFTVAPENTEIVSTNIDAAVHSSTVKLKSLTIENNKLVGTVHCLNLSFEKHFAVKLTFNNWTSSVIFGTSNFTFVKSIGHYDEFQFVINTYLHSLYFEFVVSYAVDSQVFWDNNGGKNYKVHLAMRAPHQRSPDVPKYDFSLGSSDSTGAGSPTDAAHTPDLDPNYLYDKLVNIDYNAILQDYCFHSEPSQSYFSLHEGIFT